MYIFGEFWRFIHARKKYWMLPILFIMLIFVGLVLATKGTVIAPFIYTLF